MLTWAPGDHCFTRTADHALQMEFVGGSMEAPPGLGVGDHIHLDGMSATVLEAGGLGVTRVEFSFDRSLNDPTMVLLRWKDGRLARVAPSAIGEGSAVLQCE